jgi:3',5'-nucleoside bisphosphate phosphatase
MEQNKPNYECDLHAHTNRSDGFDSPAAFVRQASQDGLKVVAITDHDVVPPMIVLVDGRQLDIVDYAGSLGLRLIRGIEISCDTDVEDVHILAFGCDWQDAFFAWLDEFTETSKRDGYLELITKLNAQDIQISLAEIEEPGGKSLQKKRIYELLAKKGYAASWEAAKLLIAGNPAFATKRRKPDPAAVIGRIHQAGGIAILAHPYLIDPLSAAERAAFSRDHYIRDLIEAGLDGIEGLYTYDKTSYRGSLSKEQICAEIFTSYADQVGVISGGSDYHGDGRTGIANARRLGECGISLAALLANPLLRQLV